MNYPRISVIIPRRADDSAEAAIQAVRQAGYPQELVEIIEVIGANPSKQRNLAAAAARGDILYFLDNDSIVTPTLFARVMKYYADAPNPGVPTSVCHIPVSPGKLAGIGGPNLTAPTDGFWQQTFGYALASPFAHSTMCARYKPIGVPRAASEKELILCNLSIRKDIFLRAGGFDETMYPNEENEFINRLLGKGYTLLYDPDACVYRSRRNHCRAFAQQLFHYGRGRAAQIRVEGFSWQALLFLLPVGFSGYLAALLLLRLFGELAWWMALPLLLYGVLAMQSAWQDAVQARNSVLVVILPVWYLLMHLSYGAGLVCGFLREWRLFPAGPEQSAEQVEIVMRKLLE